MTPKKLYLLFLIITILPLASCKKDKYDPIPEPYVNFYLNISSTLYLNLTTVGGWENITGGYKGIIVYRKSTEEFMAFERACPHDWQVDSGYISVDATGLKMKCKSCQSEFLIIDGSVLSGPSKYSLKAYKTEYDGQYLHVYN